MTIISFFSKMRWSWSKLESTKKTGKILILKLRSFDKIHKKCNVIISYNGRGNEPVSV